MADRKRRRLDNYELLSVVKETATGKIYKARDTETGQEMLLKVLKSSRRDSPQGQPRYYEVPAHHGSPHPQGPYAPYQPARTGPHPGSVIAVLLALVLVGLGGYFLGGHMKERELADQAERTARTPAPPEQPTAPAPQETTPEEQPDEGEKPDDQAREKTAAQALADAETEWDRMRRHGDYEGGVLAFETVATQYAGTEAASEARARAGRILRDWGVELVNDGEYAAAREKLQNALDFLPRDSRYVESVKGRLPTLTIQMARQTAEDGDVERALELYEEAERMAEDDAVKAEVALARAELLWKEVDDHAAAYARMMELSRRFPDSRAATAAMKNAPAVLADGARRALEQGEYEQARDLVARLREDWPESAPAGDIAQVDAEALFEQFRTAFSEDRAVHNKYYKELFKQYAGTDWAKAALRRKLGQRPGDKPMSAQSIQSLLSKARENREAGRYQDAIEGLELVVQSSEPTSPAGRRALEDLPRWLYEAVIKYHGTGLQDAAMRMAQRLSEHFPHTRWYEKAEAYRYGVVHAPKGMVFIPEGSFLMGTDAERTLEILRTSPALRERNLEQLDVNELRKAAGMPPELPRHQVTTGAYYIDKTEVTNQDYKRFCEQTGHAPPPHWKEGTYEIGQDLMPVSNVTLADAEAYAKWREARVPSEAEWEKAARGVDGRLFPWGSKWSPEKAHHVRRRDAGAIKVGSHPDGASPYGCLDMIGNVAEWTTSAYKAYEGNKHELSPALVGRAVVRGGGWWDPWQVKLPARCASRFAAQVDTFDRSMGFRCVVDVQTPEHADEKVARAD